MPKAKPSQIGMTSQLQDGFGDNSMDLEKWSIELGHPEYERRFGPQELILHVTPGEHTLSFVTAGGGRAKLLVIASVDTIELSPLESGR